MANKFKSCVGCKYLRPEGAMDFDIDGHGQWCSNSKAFYFRQRAPISDGCDRFTSEKQKAPLWMRMANKVIKKM